MRNFVHVGRVLPSDPRKDDREVVVGVRADLGQVVMTVDGQSQAPVPPLGVDQAQRLATLIAQAATKAGELAEAYRIYQEALQAAEDAFAEATGGRR